MASSKFAQKKTRTKPPGICKWVPDCLPDIQHIAGCPTILPDVLQFHAHFLGNSLFGDIEWSLEIGLNFVGLGTWTASTTQTVHTAFGDAPMESTVNFVFFFDPDCSYQLGIFESLYGVIDYGQFAIGDFYSSGSPLIITGNLPDPTPGPTTTGAYSLSV